MTRTRTATSFLALAALLSAPVAAAFTPQHELLRQRVEQLASEGSLTLGDSQVVAHRLIPELCQRFDFQPAWSSPAMVEELLTAVRGAPSHGLDPADYHLEAIEDRLAAGHWQSDDSIARTDLELLLTDSLARLAFTLHYGKLDPERLDPVWNLSRSMNNPDPVGLFEQVLRTGRIADFLRQAQPEGLFYERLREGLAEYRRIADGGGWPTVPDGRLLKVGMSDPRVPTLRERLEATADYTGDSAPGSTIYDEPLEAAVKQFQARHGIDPDGKVGPRTMEELNIPAEARVDQLRASLERTRWVFRDLEDDLLIVNIAGFELYLFSGGELAWTTPVQVGKPYHATPVFKSTMKYLVVNPTWTIPPGILRNETLPRVRKDPGYLKKQNMSVVTSSGKVVDPSTIDWNAPFRYSIRQEPGPGNALGRIKFIFPNRFYVYLHDTPSKGLFARSERAFSHGCIRVQDPLLLAELLLQDADGWDRPAIDTTIAGKKTTTVFLPEPLTVMLLYWTAVVDPKGDVVFFNDVYQRDAAIIEGLNAPFEFSAPKGLPEALGR